MSEPLRILTTEIQPWRLLKAQAESDLGFELEFIEKDFISAQRTAAVDPGSYDVYDQCFHNLDIVWYWRAIQAIDTRRITHWDDLDDLTRTAGASAQRGLGDVPASRLFVQHDATLSDSPTGSISMLPTFYNFDSFAVEASQIDVDKEITSWAELLNPKWAGQVALVDEPAIGLFDLAMALSAAGQMEFENMGNMSVREIDTLVDHAQRLIHSGHLSPFWLRADEPVERFLNGELKLASIWSPTIVEMKRQGMSIRQARPVEGYRAWHGGMCLSRNLDGRMLDKSYEWLNWYLDGHAGAVVARQGYYMSVPDRVKARLPKADWDYWYEGLPASQNLCDAAGRPTIQTGEIRSGGSRQDRARHIAIWNSTMDEHNYVVRRWNELVALAASKSRPQRRVS
ncbi:spermidine/putrescine ABC transporter periplasmic substrate-binding protein [Thalassovita gelatinovora]|uniref:Spermidine/putrescine ABC transporter periplasmic substrate-binding protein n=1 Tax=Thalassovita gelatinovora TaxID=53501 RepID=A0A0P1FI62_THAGE|nr:extracellular solute-binding protein [Thalassovita gelatinovora]QIZ82029.1 signal peptide prediction [Thalassovita gelatinovora]CUH67507.1 spermidine/putrescine ABC transporter periplasmic substrate-binding protein [Thalassovita gelatinovora]SEP72739.1 putative spermidine/putrescine transport system substrate-binding protein [Thalassovita gelatinovora]